MTEPARKDLRKKETTMMLVGVVVDECRCTSRMAAMLCDDAWNEDELGVVYLEEDGRGQDEGGYTLIQSRPSYE